MGVIPARLLVHTVAVEAFAGEGPFGPTFSDSVTVRAFVDETTRLIRSGTGDQVVSSTTVYTAPGVTAPVGSRVTLPSGREATVLAVYDRDGAGLPVPSHVELALT